MVSLFYRGFPPKGKKGVASSPVAIKKPPGGWSWVKPPQTPPGGTLHVAIRPPGGGRERGPKNLVPPPGGRPRGGGASPPGRTFKCPPGGWGPRAPGASSEGGGVGPQKTPGAPRTPLVKRKTLKPPLRPGGLAGPEGSGGRVTPITCARGPRWLGKAPSRGPLFLHQRGGGEKSWAGPLMRAPPQIPLPRGGGNPAFPSRTPRWVVGPIKRGDPSKTPPQPSPPGRGLWGNPAS